MTSPRIPLAGPSITDREVDYVLDAVQNGWYGQRNEYPERFCRAFAESVSRRYAIDLPSATSGIHLALAAMGIGAGDEVIVPDLTWIASAAPIRYVGATAVFADVDPRTWCVSAETLRVCITPRTRAVIVVDLYGSMPDWDAIVDVASEYGLAVIEDAAEAVGARWQGRPAGSFGDASVFSFHGSKTITTGEGGMLVMDRSDLFERVCVLRDHGRAPGDMRYQNSEVAFKYRMSSLQAALGLAQLERVDELVARKREIFGWYTDALDDLPLTLNPEPEGAINGCWLTTAVVDRASGISKTRIGTGLGNAGIDTRPFFNPLSSLDAYRGDREAGLAQERNVVAYDLSPRGISLPSAATLERSDVDDVARELRNLLTRRESPADASSAR